MKYFFDVVLETSVQYDFKGREFERIDQVREIAELIALDIECVSDEEQSTVLEVQVRNVGGTKILAIPVRAPELVAA